MGIASDAEGSDSDASGYQRGKIGVGSSALRVVVCASVCVWCTWKAAIPLGLAAAAAAGLRLRCAGLWFPPSSPPRLVV